MYRTRLSRQKQFTFVAGKQQRQYNREYQRFVDPWNEALCLGHACIKLRCGKLAIPRTGGDRQPRLYGIE